MDLPAYSGFVTVLDLSIGLVHFILVLLKDTLFS